MVVVTEYPEGGYWAVFELQVGVIVALLLLTCKSRCFCREEVLLTFFSTAGSVPSWVFVWVTSMPEKEAGLRQWQHCANRSLQNNCWDIRLGNWWQGALHLLDSVAWQSYFPVWNWRKYLDFWLPLYEIFIRTIIITTAVTSGFFISMCWLHCRLLIKVVL